ncbi:DegT/DnrJ/EryC1/StrS aminotransferase [Streptomyces sp. WZ.A104]|uniref:DegT/DnrJ/EryC1/StrS family aminotransferase n=1 Tax=Streptomyces sp. WZ.A104 TaxID=2023771 RepID=UPI000BBBC529|nr:DegT/DnrJ/EryC1/StrS family aminotransferase [Streptomyces sp. WZ.A104]PCG86035.1 DegT/DnrJ/EryC1/StrS aminotransferase [Streptomyces sp. WZ.A104]
MQISSLRRLLDTGPTGHPAPLRSRVERLARVEDAHRDVRVTASTVTVSNGLRRERMTLGSPARGEFPAVLLSPEDEATAPRPGILVLGGKNARLDHLTGETPPDHPDRNVAERLARAGFTTLTFAYGIGGGLDPERLAGRDEGALLAHAFALTGRSLLGALVGDALGALDVLRSHPLADADRTGLFGHSLGAAVALHTALLSDRPLPVCAASHLGTYPALYGRLFTGFEGAALPGILEHADLPDLYTALAPAPLQLQYGTADPYLETADTRAAAETVRLGYETAGAPKPDILELPMGHNTHAGHAAEFFARELADAPAHPAPVPAQRIRFDVTDRRTVLERVDGALASGVLTQGPLVARFEELSRTWTGTPGVAVASGSAALEIALRTIGVAGRTVLVPVNTFFATAAAAVRAGARARFVDMEPDGLGMDPDALRTALERYPDTAAVVPVHIGGIVSPAVDGVLATCAERGIPVLEDAAHAFGSTLGDRPAGSLGRFGAFSFFPTKVAISGEGGLLTSAAPEDREDVRRWRDHGKSAQGSTLHDRPGSNWRLSELHAAVGTVDLERFAGTLARRRSLAAHYDTLLDGVSSLRAHAVPADSRSNYYKYLVYPDSSVDRDALKQRLRERHGVQLAGEVYDRLLCDHPHFRDDATDPEETFARGRWFARHHIALPLYPSLTHAEQIRVVSALRSELP